MFGGLSVLLYKPWRRRIDRKRLRNVNFEPLPADTGAEAEDDVESRDSGRAKEQPKTFDVSVQPVETTDAAGPSTSR